MEPTEIVDEAPKKTKKKSKKDKSKGDSESASSNSSDDPNQGKLIFIPAIGSMGDTLPFVALAKRLHKMGYRVRLGTHDRYKSVGQIKGIEWVEIKGDLEWALANTPEGIELARHPSIFKTDLAKKVMFPLMKEWMEGIMTHAEGADLMTLPLTGIIAGYSAMDKYPNLKLVNIHLYPTTPSSEYAPAMAGSGSTSWFNWVNKMKWAISDKVAWSLWEDEVNKFRAKHNLPPLKGAFRDLFATLRNPHPLTLTAYSQELLRAPADWPNHTGSIPPLLPEPENRSYDDAPKDLIAFLDDSLPKPIYIGVGSMMGCMLEPVDQEKVVNEWIKGINAANVRALVNLAGMDQALMDKFKNTDSIYFIRGFIPHHWLFPKVAAVVHHGGAGSTHAGLYFGLPTLILPFGADQPFNADRIYINKLGPEGMPIRSLGHKAFAKALKDLTTNQTYKDNCARVAAVLRSEDGVGTAAQIIVDVLNDKPPVAPFNIVAAPAAK